jgi:hypothetical protein
MSIHREQKFALSAGRLFTRVDEHYFFSQPPMSYVDYSNVFLCANLTLVVFFFYKKC